MKKLHEGAVERMAVEHEAFGFGQVDSKGYTTHGFYPDGLENFVHAVIAEFCQINGLTAEAAERREQGQAVEWSMFKDGRFYDAISPEEHDRKSGAYTIPLYATPPAGVPDGFPPRIMELLRDVADRKGSETRGPWEDGNGEPLQDDADAAIAWVLSSAPQPAPQPPKESGK